jgi:hypothetical protein
VFKRLFKINRPKFNVFLGIFLSMIQGAIMPVIGAIMAKMLFVLLDTRDLAYVRSQSNEWCGVMIGLAVAAAITGFM